MSAESWGLVTEQPGELLWALALESAVLTSTPSFTPC